MNLAMDPLYPTISIKLLLNDMPTKYCCELWEQKLLWQMWMMDHLNMGIGREIFLTAYIIILAYSTTVYRESFLNSLCHITIWVPQYA